MFKKSVWTLVCFLVILGFGIADCYGKAAKKCQKTEVSAADANSTKTCPIRALFKKCGLEKKACPKDCKKACCVKKATDANTADPNSKNTGVVNSLMKKCGLDKKVCCKKKCSADCKKTCSADCKGTCCVKKVADANTADPNSKDTGMMKSLMKKCGLEKKACPKDCKKACCVKKPADANTPAAK